GLVEVVDALEILEGILIALAHEAALDHGEDDAAEVVGAGDAPAVEHEAGEHAEAVDGVVSQADAELLAVDVLVGPAAVGAVDHVDGVLEPFTDEEEGGLGVVRGPLKNAVPVNLRFLGHVRISQGRPRRPLNEYSFIVAKVPRS